MLSHCSNIILLSVESSPLLIKRLNSPVLSFLLLISHLILSVDPEGSTPAVFATKLPLSLF